MVCVLVICTSACESYPDAEPKAQQIYRETDSLVNKASNLFTSYYAQNKIKVQQQNYKEELRLLGDSLTALYDFINLSYSEKIGLRNYSREDQERFMALIDPAKEYVKQLKTLFQVNNDIHATDQLTLDNFCFYTREVQATMILADMYKNNPGKESRFAELELENKTQQQKADEIGAKLIEYKKTLDEGWKKARANFVAGFSSDVKMN